MCVNMANNTQVPVCHMFRKSSCIRNVTNQPWYSMFTFICAEKEDFQCVSVALNFLRNAHTDMSFTAFEILLTFSLETYLLAQLNFRSFQTCRERTTLQAALIYLL